MNTRNRKVIWDDEAKQQLRAAYTFIKRDSPKNAAKVRGEIIALTKKIALYPEIYSVDKYKADNDGSYRAFEKHRYRIAYKVSEKEIRILRVRHTSMEPLSY